VKTVKARIIHDSCRIGWPAFRYAIWVQRAYMGLVLRRTDQDLTVQSLRGR